MAYKNKESCVPCARRGFSGKFNRRTKFYSCHLMWWIRDKRRTKVERSRLTSSDANKDQSVRKICLRAKVPSKIKRYATGFNISSRALLPCINFLRGKMNLIPRLSREKERVMPAIFSVRRGTVLVSTLNPTSSRARTHRKKLHGYTWNPVTA